MCGRARCSLAREAVLTAAGVPEQRWRDPGQYQPSYNCSPGAWMPVLRLGADGTRELQTMKWGLVPGFTRLAPGERPDHYRMFNARCESLTQKSVFSRLLPGKRCVVLLDGFYEWHSQGGGGGAASRKQPYHITTADGPKQPVMYMAGLYDVYRAEPNGEPLHTFTIVTTDSSQPLAWLHDRMPVILTTPEEVAQWLGEAECKGAASGKACAADPVAVGTPGDTQPVTAGGGTAPAPSVPKSPPADARAEAPPSMATPAAAAKRSATAHPVGVDSVSPSTPSSLSCRRRVSGGPGTAVGPLGPCSAERRPAGTAATDAIEILDDEADADGGRSAGGGGRGGEVKDATVGSPGGDGDDDDDRCSQGKVGGSQEEGKAARRGQHGRAKGEAGSEAVRQQVEELVEKICRPYGGPLLKWHPVTPEMSKPGYDKPDCYKDVRTKKGSISSFFKPAVKGASPASAPAAAVKKEEPLPQQRPEAGRDTGGARQGEADAEEDAEEPVGGPETAARNPDQCEGSGGDVRKQGLKRAAEVEVQGAGPAAAKKR